MDYYLQLAINGLVAGSIYAIVAVGFALIYGVLRIVNFAHGATCVLGGYIGFVVVATLKWPVWSAFVMAALGGAFVGWLLNRVAFRPFREKSDLLPMIASLAFAIILENGIAAIWGHSSRSFSSELGEFRRFQFFGAVITSSQIAILIVAFFLVAFLFFYIKKTSLGRQTLAVSDDVNASATWGIDADFVITANCMLASSLASLGGLLIAFELDVDPYMGTDLTFKAFTANLLFGIGSLPGALLGGESVGMIENLVSGILSTRYRSAYTFIILILVLLVRPNGILNVQTRRFEA